MPSADLSLETFRLQQQGHVAILTIDRPTRLNSLSPRSMEELATVLQAIDEDRGVRCLVITGSGERSFSTGFDLDGLAWPERSDEVYRMVEGNLRTFMRIWDLRVPVIAAVNGYAIAAGSNLALICDITIAASNARFGEPEVRHFALSPMLLLPWFATNRKMAHYLYYSGDTIDAEEALRLGLVARVVPEGEVLAEAVRMAERIALVPPFAVEATKESLRRTYEAMGFRSALQQHRALDTVMLAATGIPERERFFDLMREGDMKAFLAERDGPFKAPEGSR
jgi:enoyl-CoA hydratase/carnithine racemase